MFNFLKNRKATDDLVSDLVIKQCRVKDQRAFRTLYNTCIPYVFTIVKGYTCDHDLQKDIIQEVFANVFLKINNYDPDRGMFKTWIRMITVSQCLIFVRDKLKYHQFEAIDETLLDQKSLETDFNGPYADDVSLAKRILSVMPEGYRNVFSLVMLEGYSHEVGEQLGISADTSRSQLARSKQWLNRHLKNR